MRSPESRSGPRGFFFKHRTIGRDCCLGLEAPPAGIVDLLMTPAEFSVVAC